MIDGFADARATSAAVFGAGSCMPHPPSAGTRQLLSVSMQQH